MDKNFLRQAYIICNNIHIGVDNEDLGAGTYIHNDVIIYTLKDYLSAKIFFKRWMLAQLNKNTDTVTKIPNEER